ncbi:MAG: NlpC/P60 family protein [Armatimonadota bacterium]
MGKSGGFDYLRVLAVVFIVLLGSSIGVYLLPDMKAASRLVLASTFILGLVCLVLILNRILYKWKNIRYTGLILLLLCVIWTIFGGGAVKTDDLRDAYIEQLLAYRNTPFAWGGETKRGVDCSGLARTAFWQAMLKHGVRTNNPRLFGPYLWRFWWLDMSAKAMKDNEYGYTVTIDKADRIVGYNPTKLKKGDLAIVVNMHVLIYLGDNRWIEACPDDNKVVIKSSTVDTDHPWFNAGPVTFLRWSMLN